MSENERNEWIQRVDTALDDIRPHLAVDGGNIQVMGLTDDFMVEVKWLGNCEMCSMSTMTMKAGVEQAIKARIPQINGVVALNGVQ